MLKTLWWYTKFYHDLPSGYLFSFFEVIKMQSAELVLCKLLIYWKFSFVMVVYIRCQLMTFKSSSVFLYLFLKIKCYLSFTHRSLFSYFTKQANKNINAILCGHYKYVIHLPQNTPTATRTQLNCTQTAKRKQYSCSVRFQALYTLSRHSLKAIRSSRD